MADIYRSVGPATLYESGTRYLALAAARSTSEFFSGTGFPACHLLLSISHKRPAGKPVPLTELFASHRCRPPLPSLLSCQDDRRGQTPPSLIRSQTLTAGAVAFPGRVLAEVQRSASKPSAWPKRISFPPRISRSLRLRPGPQGKLRLFEFVRRAARHFAQISTGRLDPPLCTKVKGGNP